MTISWEKPDGTLIETNDMKATILYCEGRGWKQKGASSLDDPEPAEVETHEITEDEMPENLPMSDPRSTEPEFQQPPDEPEAA